MAKIFSFARDALGLRPIEVEISFLPGIPTIHLLGLPDSAIKESTYRIKSAFRHQGFSMPRAQQVIVNLKPQWLPKSSQGLELAIAVGILQEAGEISIPHTEIFAYGELTLKGEVVAPEDLSDLGQGERGVPLITGPIGKFALRIEQLSVAEVGSLADLRSLQFSEISTPSHPVRPFPPDGFKVSAQQARWLEVVATGAHPTLFAGPPGTGKTTIAQFLRHFLFEMRVSDEILSRQIHRRMGVRFEGCPIVVPHHSATIQAIVGGGRPLVPGEISRAHGGLLIFDEFLEFDPRIQDSLREPLDRGQITLARSGDVSVFPARFLFLGTTNFCSCGKFVPGNEAQCHCRTLKLLRYFDRLSGPLMDRFAMLAFSHEWEGERTVSLSEIQARVESAWSFSKEHRSVKGPIHWEPINEGEWGLITRRADWLQKAGVSSERRALSWYKVARSLADLEASSEIQTSQWDEAWRMSIEPFQRLQRARQEMV